MASSSEMQRVVLDTNALLMPFETSINIDHELGRLLGNCEIFVPGPVIGELKRIKSKHAKAALTLARKYIIAETRKQGDEGIIQVAKELGAYVLTNDKELRSRLRKMGIPTIYLRSGKYLQADEI
jgi:rRNA-processing protein FCF1